MVFINHKKIPIRDSYLKCGAKLLCSLPESEKSLIFSLHLQKYNSTEKK